MEMDQTQREVAKADVEPITGIRYNVPSLTVYNAPNNLCYLVGLEVQESRFYGRSKHKTTRQAWVWDVGRIVGEDETHFKYDDKLTDEERDMIGSLGKDIQKNLDEGGLLEDIVGRL